MPTPSTSAEKDRQARELRAAARDIFLSALSQSTIASAFSRHIEYQRGVLRVCEDLYPISSYDRVSVLAIGKGAHAMVEALAARVGETLSGVVVGTTDPAAQLRSFRYFRGGHPLPTRESLLAGRAILRYVNFQPAHSLAIFLISGGGSAAAEYPLHDELSLGDIVQTYRALVHSGAPIAEINAIRKHLSAIKGGRLARAAAPAQQLSIFVSDVPETQLDSLSSGMTMPDSTSVEDCYRIAQRHHMLPEFPPAVRELFTSHALEETPKSDDPAFIGARWWTILSNSSVQAAAAAKAASFGFAAEVDNSCDDWDYARAADYLLEKLRRLRRGVSRACLISGGEVTVKVGQRPGTGGRNQQFALYCAEKIAGEDITLLSAGTDGIDGNSLAAGAIADGTTVARARAAGYDPDSTLRRFNSFPLFDALGDTIMTGPTDNNLRDLRVLIAY